MSEIPTTKHSLGLYISYCERQLKEHEHNKKMIEKRMQQALDKLKELNARKDS